jgi:hypothetical protein
MTTLEIVLIIILYIVIGVFSFKYFYKVTTEDEPMTIIWCIFWPVIWSIISLFIVVIGWMTFWEDYD